MEKYWDKYGNIHTEGEKEANIAQKAYSTLLSKLANVNKQDAIVGGIGIGVGLYGAPYLFNEAKMLKNIQPASQIAEIAKNFPTLDYYKNPNSDFRLLDLTSKSLELLKRQNKPVSLKQNIVEKNKSHHPEVDIEAYNEILNNSLYSPNYIMQVQPNKKPNYYTFINKDKYDTSVLDLDDNKPNYEVVNWFRVNDKRLKNYIKRTKDEGGEFLIND